MSGGLNLPSDFMDEGMRHLRMGDRTLISREGFVLPQRYKDHGEYFRLLRGREAIGEWLKRKGIDATPSNSGRIADQILSALGGFRGCRLIADRETVELLDDMAKSVRRYPDGTEEEFADRSVDARRWKALVARRGNERFAAKIELEEFIKAKSFRLGLALACPNCSKENWYGLGDLRDEVMCQQCLRSFDFPQGGINFDRTGWKYRVVGPFTVPDYADGAYSTVLTLRVFANNVGPDGADLIYATGTKVKLDARTSREIDFAFWYSRGQLFEHDKEPPLVFGEAKSFGQDAFDAQDVDTMRRIAEKIPGAFFVFSTLKDALSEQEKTTIGAFAMWGREHGQARRSRAPVIVLTGHELFSAWYIGETWKEMGGRHAQFVVPPSTHLDNLATLAEFTQQLYLDLPHPRASS